MSIVSTVEHNVLVTVPISDQPRGEKPANSQRVKPQRREKRPISRGFSPLRMRAMHATIRPHSRVAAKKENGPHILKDERADNLQRGRGATIDVLFNAPLRAEQSVG